MFKTVGKDSASAAVLNAPCAVYMLEPAAVPGSYNVQYQPVDGAKQYLYTVSEMTEQSALILRIKLERFRRLYENVSGHV